MTTFGDKRPVSLSGNLPTVESLFVLEELRRIKFHGGSGRQSPGPRLVCPSGPAPRFALLPQQRSRWREFTCSFLTQTLGILLLSVASIYAPKTFPVARDYVAVKLLDPPLLVLHPNPDYVPPPLAKLVTPPPPKLEVARLEHLRAPRLLAPKPLAAPESEVKNAFQPMHIAETPRPPRPLPEVKTGVLAATNVALPETHLPPAKVQTGGFGNPLGQDGKARPGPLTVDRVGSFDLPSGPGLGNGTGGSRGASAVIASAGFGKATTAPSGTPRSSGAAVTTGGFGDTRIAQGASRKADSPAQPATVPVEILSKPRPAYTEEARRLRKEGEVVLEVVFSASGEVRVLRVLQGLGFGLDDSAVVAAKQVRFRPAQRDGRPVDSTAKLHIVFELAY